jgi:hypothetical protein
MHVCVCAQLMKVMELGTANKSIHHRSYEKHARWHPSLMFSITMVELCE